MAPYPWQTEAWEMLCRAQHAERLGHAWLLHGQPNIGKGQFAAAFARWKLCESPLLSPTAACGRCRSCTLEAAGSHPDLRVIGLLDDAKSLLIDQVRELGEFMAVTSHYGRAKVAVLNPADAMTRGAANALLKLLEEPPPHALFLLVAQRMEGLPATIRSRCQHLRMDRVPTEHALAWLAERLPEVERTALTAALVCVNNAPLAVAAALQSGLPAQFLAIEKDMQAVASGRVHAVQAAQRTADMLPSQLADVMMKAARSALSAALGLLDVRSAGMSLQSAINELNSKALTEFMSMAGSIKGLAMSSGNARTADLSDQLWLAWMRTTRPRRDPGTRK